MITAFLLAMAGAPDRAALELSWRAPDGCPGPDDVRAWIDAQASRGAVALRVDAEVHPYGDGYELALELHGDGTSSSRTLAHPDCVELARSAAFIVSVARDPVVVFARTDPVVQRPRAPPRAARPDLVETVDVVHAPRVPVRTSPTSSTPVVRRAPARRRLRDPHVALAIEGGVGLGGVPRIDADVGGWVIVGARRFRVMAGAMHTFAQSRTYPDLDRVGARVWITRAILRACGRSVFRRFALQPCGGLEVGAATGRGFGVPILHTRNEPWIAAHFAAMLEIALGRTAALWLAPTIAVPLQRPAFQVRDAGGPVWRVGAVMAGLHVGVSFRLPWRSRTRSTAAVTRIPASGDHGWR